MNLVNKSIDKNKNKCRICRKELCVDDIIAMESLLCHTCYGIISKIEVEDIEYDLYKEKIKQWLLSKYKLII